MSTLLDKLKAKQKESTFKARTEESVAVVIKSIQPLKDASRLLLRTDIGDVFCFKSAFSQGVPTSCKGLKATMVLQENGEHINCKSVDYSYDDLSQREFMVAGGVGFNS